MTPAPGLDALAACPFCGGEATLMQMETGWHVGCPCGQGFSDTIPTEAVAAWNRRALPSSRVEAPVAAKPAGFVTIAKGKRPETTLDMFILSELGVGRHDLYPASALEAATAARVRVEQEREEAWAARHEWFAATGTANRKRHEAEIRVEAAEAERDRYKSALNYIAHTFTEDSHGNMKTLPASEYQKVALNAIKSP